MEMIGEVEASEPGRADGENGNTGFESPEKESPAKRRRTQLHEDICSFVERICDVDMMQRHAALKGFELPGREQLSRLNIKEGLTWLRAIEQELLKPSPSTESLASFGQSFAKTLAGAGGAQHPPSCAIGSLEQVKAKTLELEELSDIENVYGRLLRIAAGRACLKQVSDDEGSDDGDTADTTPSKSTKRPMTAFFLFLADRRDAIKADLVASLGSVGLGEVTKKAAELWKALPEAEQEPYITTYTKAKEARDQEFADIKARQDEAAWKADPLVNRFYRMLGCQLSPISRGSPVWSLIAESALGTQPEAIAVGSHFVCLERAFSVARPHQDRMFPKKAPNRRLLWYGGPTGSWANILCNGIRLPQQETPFTGYNFGKGIYFSDMVSVAAALSSPGAKDGDRATVALAEVALGTSVERHQADSRGATKLPPGHQSIIGRGSLAPSASRVLPDGAVLPLGPVEEQPALPSLPDGATRLSHNEYVVYNPVLVRMRYLLEVRLVSGASPEEVSQARSGMQTGTVSPPLSAKRLRKKTHADEALLLS